MERGAIIHLAWQIRCPNKISNSDVQVVIASHNVYMAVAIVAVSVHLGSRTLITGRGQTHAEIS